MTTVQDKENSENARPKFTVSLQNPNRDMQVFLSTLGDYLPGQTAIDRILNGFAGIRLLDTVHLDELKSKRDNHEKIHGALVHIGVRGDAYVLKALEYLCNMGKGLEIASADIRQLIEKEFPGSVHLNGLSIRDMPASPNTQRKRKILGNLDKNDAVVENKQKNISSDVNNLGPPPKKPNTEARALSAKIAKPKDNAEEVGCTQAFKTACLAYCKSQRETVIDIDVENQVTKPIAQEPATESAPFLASSASSCDECQENQATETKSHQLTRPIKKRSLCQLCGSTKAKVITGIGVAGSLVAPGYKYWNFKSGGNLASVGYENVTMATEQMSTAYALTNYLGLPKSVSSYMFNDVFENETYVLGASK